MKFPVNVFTGSAMSRPIVGSTPKLARTSGGISMPPPLCVKRTSGGTIEKSASPGFCQNHRAFADGGALL